MGSGGITENADFLKSEVFNSNYSIDREIDPEGDRTILPDDSMAQVTPVSKLVDIQPTDWAFQAL
ncbi:MAG TPA: S-layer protein, partial [Cyanobacteria bacterium UBA12227]|nr:S-layer protein [Cyanobacteria bacterium UBA12227]